MEADFDDRPFAVRSTTARGQISTEEKEKNEQLLTELNEVLDKWESEYNHAEYHPHSVIQRIAELFEEATKMYLKKDPDPLDDRHPHRLSPSSAIGNMLKVLLRNDDFMNKLVISYILGRDVELSVISCRLLLSCIPGLEANVVFSDPDDFIPRLFDWAMDSSNEELQAYAFGLLAVASEVQENVHNYKSKNIELIPTALNRLEELRLRMEKQYEEEVPKENGYTSFAHMRTQEQGTEASSSDCVDPPPAKKRKELRPISRTRVPSISSLQNLENSNSKWDVLQPILIGTHEVYPVSLQMYQRFILQYLTQTGEYQDLLVHSMNALDLTLVYIDPERAKDIRLTFDALKYLNSLFVHRKIALEFVSRGGIRMLLKVPPSSFAAVAAVTCFYFLVYIEDVMEQICQMEDKVVDEIVQYVLWCLEHSHESGMTSACMFFMQALYYKAILVRFDQFDGPRKLYNYMATLTMLQESPSNTDYELTEEQLHTSTNCIRNACSTFRSYVAAHLFLKLEQVKKEKQSAERIYQYGLEFPENLQMGIPPYKSMRCNEEAVWKGIRLLTNLLRVSSTTHWSKIDNLRRIGVLSMICGVSQVCREWQSHSGKMGTEVAINALETIAICTCCPEVQMDLIKQDLNKFVPQSNVLCVIMQYVSGETYMDKDVRIAALHVLINCVVVHNELLKNKFNRYAIHGVPYKEKEFSLGNSNKINWYRTTLLIWDTVRRISGLKLLMEVIFDKKPQAEADLIRFLACEALHGLAKHPSVSQILSKLPLIANNELQGLMRTPLAQDKRAEHGKFKKEAARLIEMVTHKNKSGKDPTPYDLTQEKLHRAWVVANTKIAYSEKELLQMIQDHLLRKGLNETARMLRQEAELPDVPASRMGMTPSKIQPLPVAGKDTGKKPRSAFRLVDPTATPSRTAQRSTHSSSSSSNTMPPPSPIPQQTVASPALARIKQRINTQFPKKLHVSPMKRKALTVAAPTDSTTSLKPFKVLDDVVTEYLRTQHSQCSNPVTTCPPFSLFYPHKCPEPRSFANVYTNIVRRFNDRSLHTGGRLLATTSQDERYVFGHFRQGRVYAAQDEESYSCSSFSIDDEHIILGLFSGEVQWMNVTTGKIEAQTSCHNSSLTHIEPSANGEFLLTSSSFIRPLSALWSLGETQQMVHEFFEENYLKFSNLTMDYIIGTMGWEARLYDATTCAVVTKYLSKHFSSHYSKSIASLSPNDQLVLHDGMIFDIRSAPDTYVHLFDRFNETIGGVFHPHGNEVIINSEVWDLRTFRLLRSVPALDGCDVSFNSTGNILYAKTYIDYDDGTPEDQMPYNFTTIDSSDYSVITSVDSKKPIMHLSVDHSDVNIALCERLGAQSEYSHSISSQIRLLEIGKRKELDDDNDEDDGEEEEDDGGDSDSSGSNSSLASDDDDDGMRGVFDVIGHLERGERGSNSSLSSSSDSSIGSDSYPGDFEAELSDENVLTSSDSSEWETDAGDEEVDGNDLIPQEVDLTGADGDADGDEDPNDETYRPDPSDYNSTSSTNLNPHLRRQEDR